MKRLDDIQVGCVVCYTPTETNPQPVSYEMSMLGISGGSVNTKPSLGMVEGYDLPYIMVRDRNGQKLINTRDFHISIVEGSLSQAWVRSQQECGTGCGVRLTASDLVSWSQS